MTTPDDWLFGPGQQAPAHARRAIEGWAHSHGVPQRALDDLLLIVNELVTSVTHHSDGPLTLCVDSNGLEVTVRVRGNSPRQTRTRSTPVDGVHGRGLMMVRGLSKAWGGRRTSTGTVVWACLNFR